MFVKEKIHYPEDAVENLLTIKALKKLEVDLKAGMVEAFCPEYPDYDEDWNDRLHEALALAANVFVKVTEVVDLPSGEKYTFEFLAIAFEFEGQLTTWIRIEELDVFYRKPTS